MGKKKYNRGHKVEVFFFVLMRCLGGGDDRADKAAEDYSSIGAG